MHKLKLTYFKSSGKWYTDADLYFAFQPNEDFLVVEHVRLLQREGRLPGLVPDCREFHILVQSESLAVPFLVMADEHLRA